MDFKELMKTTEYDFLRTNERLGNRIMLFGLGGSYACETNNEGSYIDFRGFTLMMPSDLLGLDVAATKTDLPEELRDASGRIINMSVSDFTQAMESHGYRIPKMA